MTSVFHQRAQKLVSPEQSEKKIPEETVFHKRFNELKQKPTQSPEEKKEGFLSKLGRAFAYQAQTAGPQPTKQGQQTLAEALSAAASGATLGLSELATENLLPKKRLLPPEVGKVIELSSALAPYSLIGSGIEKITETAAKELAKYTTKNLKMVKPIIRTLGWAGIGATQEGITNLARKGELPTAKETAENAMWWGATDAILNSLGWTGRMASYLGKLSKYTGMPRFTIFKALAEEARAKGIPIHDVAQLTTREAQEEVVKDFLSITREKATAAEKTHEVGTSTIKELGTEKETKLFSKERVQEANAQFKKILIRPKETEFVNPKERFKSYIYKDLSKDEKVLSKRQWNSYLNDHYHQKYYNIKGEETLHNRLHANKTKQFATIGDLIKDPKARKWFERILDLPVYVKESFTDTSSSYMQNYLAKKYGLRPHIELSRSLSPQSFYDHLIHEAEHALQDLYGHIDESFSKKPYTERPIEIGARVASRKARQAEQLHRRAQIKTKMATQTKSENAKIDNEAIIQRFKERKVAPIAIKHEAPVTSEGLPIKEPFTKETEADVPFLDKIRKKLGMEKSKLNKDSWDLVRNMLGERWAREYKSHLQWMGDLRERFPDKKVRSDMIFYRENPEFIGKKKTDPGTGNPFVSRKETYADLESRLSPEAKTFVDVELNKHFEDMLKEFNSSPYTKDINPRDFLENIYIPHFYEGDPKKAAAMFSKAFRTKNPLSNMRKFLTFNEALQSSGLKPKFNDLSELMMAYDSIMIRSRINSELAAQIKDLEKLTEQKLIIRSGNARYDQAKKDGWVPFEDPYLRRTVVGTDKEGKPIFTTTVAPALVHPDVAPSMAGVFVKEFKQVPKDFLGNVWQGTKSIVSSLDNFVKRFRLQFSPFHYNALLESYHAAKGTPQFIKDIFTGENSLGKIAEIMKDPGIMDEMLRSGLNVHPPSADVGMEYSQLPMQRLLRSMELKGGIYKAAANVVQKAGVPFRNFNNFLFNKFHPRLKVGAYLSYKDRILNDYMKRGVQVTPEEMTKINRSIARLVNNQFGGQRWELIAGLNNPKNRQWLDRFIAYPDWTTSALREVQDAFSRDPIVRKYSRGYIGRYLAQLFTSAQLANLMTTGFYNKKDGSIGWDWGKAHLSLQNEDPTKNAFSIQLPDITINIGGRHINVGRDENGRKLYMHQGKKLFELLKYLKDPVQEIFAKSRPGIQFAVEQMTGYNPSLKRSYPIEGGYKGGNFLPWKGTEFPSLENLAIRGEHALKSALPFSITGLTNHGIGSYVFSGMGALPVSKGASMFSMEEYLLDAARKGDMSRFNKYMDVLRNEGYEQRSLKRLASKIKHQVKIEKNQSID